MISDKDIGKKLDEEDKLLPFLEEYENVTGVSLLLLERCERPDFVCDYQDEPVGIELVQVPQYTGDEQMVESDAAIQIQETVYAKEAKRVSPGWCYADRTILVLQLMYSEITDIAKYLDQQIMDEMSATGFLEIWVADYTVIEPYGTVQLLGVKPPQWRGLYSHRFNGTKPYA